MTRVYIESELYCLSRSLEAEKLKRYFEKNGWEIVNNPEHSNFNIINTCAMLTSWETRYFERIKELMKLNAELIVIGCIKKINPEKYEDIFHGKGFSPTELEQIDSLFPDFKYKFSEMEEVGECLNPFDHEGFVTPIEKVRNNKKTKWFLEASRGCEKRDHCSYCIIWKGIGEYRSKPLEECIKNIRKGIEEGHNTFHIIDTGAYGTDSCSSFPELMNKIIEIEGIENIVIETLNPKWIIKYLDQLIPITRTGKIKTIRCAHQSGSERILKLMKRDYSINESINSLLKLKEAYPPLKLITQIIVGFPSESEEDFQKTIDLVKRVGFDDLDVFPFEARPNTPAAGMQNQIDSETKRFRAARLREILKG